MTPTARVLAWWAVALWLLSAAAFDYGLKAEFIGANSYGVFGQLAHFSRDNGGFIANAAFIATSAGVVVIDTGPSKQFGEQLRALIADTTRQAPVCCVYLTHHHPDHAFGNQSFGDVPMYALPATIDAAKAEFSTFNDNMYRLVGDAMRGTAPVLPTHPLTVDTHQVGDHRLRFIPLSGHSAGDLAIFDETSGVLYAGNVFYQRAIATPQSDLTVWRHGLEQLSQLPFQRVFPAAGPLGDGELLAQNIAYLTWLDGHLTDAAFDGSTVMERFNDPIPAPFDAWPEARGEYQRSLLQLFNRYERRALGVSVHDNP